MSRSNKTSFDALPPNELRISRREREYHVPKSLGSRARSGRLDARVGPCVAIGIKLVASVVSKEWIIQAQHEGQCARSNQGKSFGYSANRNVNPHTAVMPGR